MILPELHEIGDPPSNVAHTIKTDNIKDEGVRSYWEKIQKDMPKKPKYSITEYRAIEISRLPGDSKDGFVRPAVGEGLRPVRFREEDENFIRRCLLQAGEHGFEP